MFPEREETRSNGEESHPTPPFHGQTLLSCAVSFLGCHSGNHALVHLLTDCNSCHIPIHTPFSNRKGSLTNDNLKRKPRSCGHFYSGIAPSRPVRPEEKKLVLTVFRLRQKSVDLLFLSRHEIALASSASSATATAATISATSIANVSPHSGAATSRSQATARSYPLPSPTTTTPRATSSRVPTATGRARPRLEATPSTVPQVRRGNSLWEDAMAARPSRRPPSPSLPMPPSTTSPAVLSSSPPRASTSKRERRFG